MILSDYGQCDADLGLFGVTVVDECTNGAEPKYELFGWGIGYCCWCCNNDSWDDCGVAESRVRLVWFKDDSHIFCSGLLSGDARVR